MSERKFTAEETEQIQAAYRDAKNKKAQINICAQLYAADPADICRVLGIPNEEPKKPKKLRTYDQSVKDAVVRAVLVEGMTQSAAAEKFGVPCGNIGLWIKNAKKRQAEFLNYDTEIHDKSNETSYESKKSVVKTKESVTEHRTRAQLGCSASEFTREFRAGATALQIFIDTFAGAGIVDSDQWMLLDLIHAKAEGFCTGLETAMKLMEGGK